MLDWIADLLDCDSESPQSPINHPSMVCEKIRLGANERRARSCCCVFSLAGRRQSAENARRFVQSVIIAGEFLFAGSARRGENPARLQLAARAAHGPPRPVFINRKRPTRVSGGTGWSGRLCRAPADRPITPSPAYRELTCTAHGREPAYNPGRLLGGTAKKRSRDTYGGLCRCPVGRKGCY